MVYILLRTNRTTTDQFYPLFEVVFALELRLSLCNLVVQGLLGISARLIFIYNIYAGDGPLEERPIVIFASIQRLALLEVFMGVFFFFAAERFIATLCWSWYEKGSLRTLFVFVALEGWSLVWSWSWAAAFVFEYFGPKQLIIGIVFWVAVGFVAIIIVVLMNYCVSTEMKKGARVNKYSVARAYQFRENVMIIKALLKIGIMILALNIPVLIFATLQQVLSGENANAKRMITRALFDLSISFYPPAIISYIPFSDVIFERSLKRTELGSRLFDFFAIFHFYMRPKKKERTVVNESDHYFNMLAASLSGPPLK